MNRDWSDIETPDLTRELATRANVDMYFFFRKVDIMKGNKWCERERMYVATSYQDCGTCNLCALKEAEEREAVKNVIGVGNV